MKKAMICLAALLCLLCMICCAAAEEGMAGKTELTADVMPLPPGKDDPDLENGWFGARPEDMDHAKEGWFTLACYRADTYDPEQIKNLKTGDTVLVNGMVYTLAEDITSRDIGWFDQEDIIWELVTEEENWDGLYFRKYGEDTFAAYVGDWIPCTYVGSVKVTLPLDDRFQLVHYPGGEDPDYHKAEEFLSIVDEYDWSIYNEYNTDAMFTGGKLMELSLSGYPHGPSSGSEEDDEP